MKIDQSYINLINKFKTLKGDFAKDQYVAFHAMKGKEFNNDIMFVGRALNGWHWKFKLEDFEKISSEDAYQMILKNGLNFEFSNQLNWVSDSWQKGDGYRTSNSAFWRTIKKVVIDSNSGTENNWHKKIVWSNLFKISNTKGNPRTSLKNLTYQENKDLLEAEIVNYNPKTVIFLTGINWAKEYLNLENYNSSLKLKHIEHIGYLKFQDKKYKIIVSPHPQGKKESEMASEIVQVLKNAI